MRRRLFNSLAVSAAVVLTVGGCASTGSIAPPVTPAMVGAARGASAETLEEGRRIFAGPCTACHVADPVSEYSPAEWHRVVEEMAPRTKLDPTRKAALLAYITAAHATLPAIPVR